MITPEEKELLHHVLANVDPASECGIGNDEIAKAQEIIDRETSRSIVVEGKAHEFVTEFERVLVAGLKLSSEDHGNVFRSARDLKRKLFDLLEIIHDDGYSAARKSIQARLTAEIDKL